jgi:hypothetical protein
MKLILKKIIIVVISFFIVLWIQTKDDKRNNKIYQTHYERFKLPVLVGSMIGFLFTMNEFFSNEGSQITIITPIEQCVENNFEPMQNKLNNISDFNQEIDLNLPDF